MATFPGIVGGWPAGPSPVRLPGPARFGLEFPGNLAYIRFPFAGSAG